MPTAGLSLSGRKTTAVGLRIAPTSATPHARRSSRARLAAPSRTRASGSMRFRQSCLEFDFLYAQDCPELGLVVPNRTDHRLGSLALEEELDELLGVGADDAVAKHVVRLSSCAWIGSNLQKGAIAGEGRLRPPPATPNAS